MTSPADNTKKPQTFSDSAGRVWTVSISVGTVTRVRSMLNVDLMQAIEGDLVPQLMNDVVLLCNVLYVVCKPEADARGISDVEFGESMGGDALGDGEEALLEALTFFSHPSRRDAFRKTWEKTRALRIQAAALACKRLDDPRLEQRIQELLQRKIVEGESLLPEPGSSSGLSQAS